MTWFDIYVALLMWTITTPLIVYGLIHIMFMIGDSSIKGLKGTTLKKWLKRF